MKLLAFAASQREASFNRQLLNAALALTADTPELTITHLDYRQLQAPLFNDIPVTREGLPPEALRLVDALAAHDGIIIASPEYNWSVPGHLKNLLDWVSCVRPYPFTLKPTLLLSASPSRRGGLQGLMQLQTTLTAIGADIYPRYFALLQAQHAFGTDNHLIDPDLRIELNQILSGFLAHIRVLMKG